MPPCVGRDEGSCMTATRPCDRWAALISDSVTDGLEHATRLSIVSASCAWKDGGQSVTAIDGKLVKSATLGGKLYAKMPIKLDNVKNSMI